jgi:hypothetical protein
VKRFNYIEEEKRRKGEEENICYFLFFLFSFSPFPYGIKFAARSEAL